MELIVVCLLIFIIYVASHIKEWICKHDYDVHYRQHYYDPDTEDRCVNETLICKKCGKVKKIKL